MQREMKSERIIPFIYRHWDPQKLKQHEQWFLEKSEEIQGQFEDWLIYDFHPEKHKTFAELFVDAAQPLSAQEKKEILQGKDSALGLYEVVELKEGKVQLKHLFEEVSQEIQEKDIPEKLELKDLLLMRIGDQGQIFSSNVIVLPYQFKTMLVGRIIESYERAKESRTYLTYGQFFKQFPLELLACINKLLSYENQQGDVTLHQSTFLVLDGKALKAAIKAAPQLFFPEEEGKIYQLKDHGEVIATVVLEQQRLELECTDYDELELAKELVTDHLGDHLKHLKDEELTIDDLI